MNAELESGFELDEGLVGGSAYDAHGQSIGLRCRPVWCRWWPEVGQRSL
jgi:hypothetical protein